MSVCVRLSPIEDPWRDREALADFLTAYEWPFHVVPRLSRADVDRRIEDGAYGDSDHAAYWVESVRDGRIGLTVLEDLTEGSPLFDMRLAAPYRGRGLGLRTLRALTSRVFTSMPEVKRFEGQTREDNIPMRRTFLRAGFVKEAHYREAWPVQRGAPMASVAYAILRHDWQFGTTTPLLWEDMPPA